MYSTEVSSSVKLLFLDLYQPSSKLVTLIILLTRFFFCVYGGLLGLTRPVHSLCWFGVSQDPLIVGSSGVRCWVNAHRWQRAASWHQHKTSIMLTRPHCPLPRPCVSFPFGGTRAYSGRCMRSWECSRTLLCPLPRASSTRFLVETSRCSISLVVARYVLFLVAIPFGLRESP